MALERKSFLDKVWPKYSLADKVAFSITNGGLIGIILFELLVVLPSYHDLFTTWYFIHVAAGVFMAYGVFANLYMMILTNSTVKDESLSLPSVLHQGWYYCPNCQMNAPPRAHHCPICDICVMKRDHHCIFTGNCVGYKNHRYFVVMALYLWLGCVYAVLFNLDYFSSILGGLGINTWLKLVFPLVAYLLSYVTLYQLFILIVAGICFMALFMFTSLISFQVFFITRGQTQFECKKKIREYNRGLKDNWIEVLGKQWYLTWLSPFLHSELPGDGAHFVKLNVTFEPTESTKDI